MHTSRLLLTLTAAVEVLLTVSTVSAVSMRHHILDAASNTNHLRLLLAEQDWERVFQYVSICFSCKQQESLPGHYGFSLARVCWNTKTKCCLSSNWMVSCWRLPLFASSWVLRLTDRRNND